MLRYPKQFKKINHLVGQAIADYKMIQPDDQIAVGLSGGKDSLILMHLLTQLQKKAPINFKITAVIIDGGFKDFQREALEHYCQKNSWSYKIASIEMRKHIQDKNRKGLPCSLCSRLRRGKIYQLATELKTVKIALGHNLDDICESFLIGLFRGQGLSTMGANVPADKNTKRIIRPLAYIPETDLQNLADTMKLPSFGECDFHDLMKQQGDRAFLKKEITNLEQHFSGIRQNMITSLQNVKTRFLLEKD